MTIRTLALLHTLLTCVCFALVMWTGDLVASHAWPEMAGQLVRAPLVLALMLLGYSGVAMVSEWSIGRGRLRLGGDKAPTALDHR
jgi:hypothetical protein